MRGIIIPRVGDLLYYDTTDRQMIIEEPFDETYYDIRYIPIGVVSHVAKDEKSIKVVTPYLIAIDIPTDKKKIMEKTLVKDMKSYIRKYTKDIMDKEIEDLKFYPASEKDMEDIVKDPKHILNGLEVFSQKALLNGKYLNDILAYDILLFLDGDTIKVSFGIIDNLQSRITIQEEESLKEEDKDNQAININIRSKESESKILNNPNENENGQERWTFQYPDPEDINVERIQIELKKRKDL